MEKDVNQRASAIELLAHPWIIKNFKSDYTIEKWLNDIKFSQYLNQL